MLIILERVLVFRFPYVTHWLMFIATPNVGRVTKAPSNSKLISNFICYTLK
jgi:hypothetical protein